MKQSKLNQRAKYIINTNIYLTLATSGDNIPWASPLFYCTDESNNFYFISQPSSRHIRNIATNPQASFAIFDSHQPEGTGNGVQGEGIVKPIPNHKLKAALNHYHTNFIKLSSENLKPPNPYRLYQLKPKSMYILDTEAKVDKRLPVNMTH